MTQRLKRHAQYELRLHIKDDAFVRPPKDTQRNWLLNQLMKEAAADLEALDDAASRFVTGANPVGTADRTQALLADDEIMEDWQIPLMQAMADEVCRSHGSVLEIGFGRGVASTLLQQQGLSGHDIIECNASVIERYERWREGYTERDIRLYSGLWQDRLPELGLYDGIFFHTYPLNEDEFVEQIASSVTFAEHFFAHAARHLKPGGVLTYLSFEIDSMSRAHQRALFSEFSSIQLKPLSLQMPQDVRDAWWADSMLVVSAVR